MSLAANSISAVADRCLAFGQCRTFLVNWALARQNNWEILLRIEDIDGPRVKTEFIREAIEDLRWLGLDWDVGPVTQSSDLQPYEQALAHLLDNCSVYRCRCTRAQLQAATLSAPHGGEHELRYPGICRPERLGLRAETAYKAPLEKRIAFRLIVPDSTISVMDDFVGLCEFNVQQLCGDFLVWTKQGLPSYQLAVVVDDARQEIDQVVRGDDLLSSAARQTLLYQALGLGDPPRYTHLPLVVGMDGKRLAKRHGDTRLAYYREVGVRPERVVGLLARWSGVPADELSAKEFIDYFELTALPHQPIAFQASDDRWLRDDTQLD